MKHISIINKKLKAITFVETVVYLALFGMIFVVILEFSIGIQKSNQIENNKNFIEKQKIFINEHFSDSFRNSNAFSLNECILNSDNGKLRITSDTTYKEYSLENGRLKYSENGINNFVTPDTSEVTKFFITQINDVNLNPVAVEIEIFMREKNDNQISITSTAIYTFK